MWQELKTGAKFRRRAGEGYTVPQDVLNDAARVARSETEGQAACPPQDAMRAPKPREASSNPTAASSTDPMPRAPTGVTVS